jgi:prolyl-tRNA synthetase
MLEKQITQKIEQEMDNLGFSQVRLSLLQDGEMWQKTGRIESYGEELFKVRNRKNKMFCLAATAEESITSLYKSYYHQLNAGLNVYQIGNKYRDEMRARAGLCRGKEFVMKDGYSFYSNENQLKDFYIKVKDAYFRIFEYFGLNVKTVVTDSGEMGGKYSEEFVIESSLSDSDDGLLELGHIFQLGTKYSEDFGLKDDKGQFIHMACYGIGVSRLLMCILNSRRDSLGFWGDNKLRTFDYVITAIDYEKNESVQQVSYDVYQNLLNKGYKVLLDDRKGSAGKKMSDAELIGVSKRIVISKQNLEFNRFEILDRKTMNKYFENIDYFK